MPEGVNNTIKLPDDIQGDEGEQVSLMAEGTIKTVDGVRYLYVSSVDGEEIEEVEEVEEIPTPEDITETRGRMSKKLKDFSKQQEY